MTIATKGNITERKQAEEKLQTILKTALDGFWLTNLKGKILDVNDSYCKMVGYTREELLTMSTSDVEAIESPEEVAQHIKRIIEQGYDSFESRHKRKDGKTIDVEVSVNYLDVGEGQLFVFARDITERKQTEQALADETTWRRILVGQSRDGIVVLDENGKVYEANQQFAEMLGYTPEEAAELHVWDWDTQWPRETLLGMLKSVDAAGDHFETYHRRKDGSTIDVEISTNGAVCAGQKLVFCVCRDITERKQVDAALVRAEQEKADILDSMNELVIFQDLEHRMILVNKIAAESVNLPPEQLVGRHCYEVWPQRDTPCVGCPVAKARQTGKPQETEITTPDGRVWFIRGYPMRDANGSITGALEVTLDITERKQAKEALQAEKNKLQSVIDAMADGLSIQDRDFNIIYQNEQSRIGAGRDCLGEKCYRVYEGRDRVCDGCPVKKAFKDGKSHTSERRSVTPSGEVLFWENTANPIRDAQGNIVSCLEITRDITERKKAEQALADEATRRRILIDQSLDGIVVLDENSKVYEANQRFAEMLGYTPEEVRELHTWDWDTQWSREELLEMGRKVDATGYHLETYHRRKDGTTIDVEISINGAVCSGQKLIFCVCRDITERKRAEEALQAEKNKLQSLINAMEDGLNILDKDYNIIYQNEPLRRLYGDRIGEKCYRVYEGEEKVCDGCPVKKAFKDGKSHTSERKILAPSGEVAYWENTANPIRDARGKIVSCLEITRNITERKQVEEALRQSEKKYKNLAEATSDMIWEADERGTFTFVSPRIKDVLGYEASEVTGKIRTLDLTTKAETQKWLKRFKEINAKKEPFFGFEITHLHKNGTPVLFEISGIPTFDNAGNFKGYVGVNKDITERKQIEEQLQEEHEQLDAQNEELRTINEELQTTEEELQHSQERLERMFESVTDGISVINLNGVITKVNQRTVEIHGFASEDEMLGRNAFDLVSPRDHERIAADMRQALKEGLIISGEYTMLRADGSEFPGELSTSVLKDGRGKAMGHISTVRDITERKQAEEREKQLEQELNLAGRLASIGQLAAGVAHEINNPLTGVIGFSHLMMNRNIPNDMKQDLQVINSEAQRVAKIVENLLVFAHQRKTGREYVFINDIITKVLELRAYEMKVNNIEVETQLDPNLPLTMADTGQLQQVFLNIVLNAEYSMNKTHHKGNLLVKTEQIKGNIRASLTDNGAGISRENLDKIFNPFFTTKEVGRGTGLGLSICHGIITQHKGRIYAQSESGRGATFVIELPIVAEPAQADKAKKTKKEPQKPRGAKILVVDDEEAILTFLRRLLTEWGHSVETINTADAALERLKTERYSLILLDIKLPGMSGIELYRHIEEIAPALTRRVMFITGDIMEGTTRDFLEKAGVPHITKPIDIEVLKKMMNNALNQTQVAPKASG